MATSRLLTCLCLALSAVAAADPLTAPGAIRAEHPWLAEAMEVGMSSPTFAALASRIRDSRLIVHLDRLPPHIPWDGRTRFVGVGGGYRYVRVEIRRQSKVTTAAVLAHELRHVLEIQDADVRSVRDVERLYLRIGTAAPGTPAAFDTMPAVAAGVATLAELTGRRAVPGRAGPRIRRAVPGSRGRDVGPRGRTVP